MTESKKYTRARVRRSEGVRGLGSSDVLGLLALKAHELGLGFPKVHECIKVHEGPLIVHPNNK